MSKQYIHTWKCKNGKAFIQEHDVAIGNIDAAIEEYYQQQSISFRYSHTLVIDTETLACHMVNIEVEIEFRKVLEEEDSKPEYESLTGHEMGVCAGRV